jgi:hypothetical protein
MKGGDHVEVLWGSYAGRRGVVESIWIEGVAVRIAAVPPLWPFPRIVVFDHADLKRIRMPKSKGRMPDADEAPF